MQQLLRLATQLWFQFLFKVTGQQQHSGVFFSAWICFWVVAHQQEAPPLSGRFLVSSWQLHARAVFGFGSLCACEQAVAGSPSGGPQGMGDFCCDTVWAVDRRASVDVQAIGLCGRMRTRRLLGSSGLVERLP